MAIEIEQIDDDKFSVNREEYKDFLRFKQQQRVAQTEQIEPKNVITLPQQNSDDILMSNTNIEIPTREKRQNVITSVITSSPNMTDLRPKPRPVMIDQEQFMSEIIKRLKPEPDPIEAKVAEYLASKNQIGKRRFFRNPFLKKKMPKNKSNEKFDKWLNESCENECFLCDKCEVKIRGIIEESWQWIEKINLK